MNWFDTSGLTNLAKTALKEAQKTIDKALDIQDESGEEQEGDAPPGLDDISEPTTSKVPQKDSSDFFSSWGLTMSAESSKEEHATNIAVVTESPTKGTNQSVWGSFAGSFFEQPQSETDSTIIRPPKAKSMNLISDANYGSQDDLFSKSQLVMLDGTDTVDLKKSLSKLEENVSKSEERRSSSRSAGLSLLSSRNSSDSVEVLSHSLKTTPDSDAASIHSISHSSSAGQKPNSESVEILPDSLVSPSSIECLGFDSYASDKISSSSSNVTPEGDESGKKSTPVGDQAGETADSVSLVADDDEDTISYNSISECTAPTVLDNDDKPISPFQKSALRIEPQRKFEKELLQLDQPVFQKMQMSENSSNDGSWSDRTLNADNDSINFETNIEDQKKELDREDILIERLSDSSSFYNVQVCSEMIRSQSSAFVNVEKQQCRPSGSNSSSQKDGSSGKERTSPVSSDSKSDLVKIGSDRTSGHTSGDELETTTSSDIEIIPSPNGDSGNGYRNSPMKYGFKQVKLDGSVSPNLVDILLGKTLATKIRGHNRELSEASIQSTASDDSQGSENDRLMRRLCEMAEILEARETRLMEVSRNNAELAESNADLKTQMESLLAKHEIGDINTITEDYTQRMSALEKKFQQAIREKDQLRKQLDSLKSESSSRKHSSELENALKEKDDMITQLQEEGEKLSRQQLLHSNIIKKLRVKEKDNEQVIKSLRDKISEQTSDLDRLKRAIAAKEELEVTQIEAVYRLTTTNRKLETELLETKSTLDDTVQRLASAHTSLEAARRELSELQRSAADSRRRGQGLEDLAREKELLQDEAEQLRSQLQQLRTDMVHEERRWAARTEALRLELSAARAAGAEGGGGSGAGEGAAPLLAQLAALQRGAAHRERAHAAAMAHAADRIAELETALAKASERCRLLQDENSELAERVSSEQARLEAAEEQLTTSAEVKEALERRLQLVEATILDKSSELENVKSDLSQQITELNQKLQESERQLSEERTALDTEKKRNAILQEQLSSRGDISPVQSLASDTLSGNFWASGSELDPLCVGSTVPTVASAGGAAACETLAATLQRREGEVRALRDQVARLSTERRALAAALADLRIDHEGVQAQYEALLQMYGEKEEQLAELRLDLHDVTQLYKGQLSTLLCDCQRGAHS